MDYWLRPNKYDNFSNNPGALWKTKQLAQMNPGDKYILYISKEPGKYFLVGEYEYLGGTDFRKLLFLDESEWVKRPPVSEWRELLRESLQKNTSFNIEKTGWVGRIASEGLKLTEQDYNKLKVLLVKPTKSFSF